MILKRNEDDARARRDERAQASVLPVVEAMHPKMLPPSDAERMAKAIPNARLVRIANAGHLSNFEQPERFNEIVA